MHAELATFVGMNRDIHRAADTIDSSTCAVCGDPARVMCPCLQRHFCTLECQNADWTKGGHHLVCKFDKNSQGWNSAAQQEVSLTTKEANESLSQEEALQASGPKVLGICELLSIPAAAASSTTATKKRRIDGDLRHGNSRSNLQRSSAAIHQEQPRIEHSNLTMRSSPSHSSAERKLSHPENISVHRRSTHPFADTQHHVRQETSLPNYRSAAHNERDDRRYQNYTQATSDLVPPNFTTIPRNALDDDRFANEAFDIDMRLDTRRQYYTSNMEPQMPMFRTQNKPGPGRMDLLSNDSNTSAARYQHESQRHSTKTISNSNASNHKSESSAKVRVCTWEGCNRTFTRSDHFTRHLNTHTGHRPFSCAWDGCGKSFGQANNLTRHLKTHKKDKLYSCSWEGCTKTFSEANNLANHFRQHSGAGPHLCSWDDCKKAFADPGYLAAHERTHSRTEVFRCSEDGCDRSFSTRNYLKTHMRTHTIEKPFACTQCFKRFNQSSNLSRHVRTHDLEQAAHMS